VAKLTAAFGVSNTVVGDSERRCHRHKDGPPPHTLKQHDHQNSHPVMNFPKQLPIKEPLRKYSTKS